MIITYQTVVGFAQLLFFSFITGIVLSTIYCNAVLVSPICSSIKNASEGCKSFINSVRKNKKNHIYIAVSDFLICLLASCTICVLIFIFNSGQFRAISVLFLIVGFFCGKSVLEKLLIYPIAFFAFIIISITQTYI